MVICYDTANYSAKSKRNQFFYSKREGGDANISQIGDYIKSKKKSDSRFDNFFNNYHF